MLKLQRNGRSANLLLEILMMIVGINVALWFENWFQDLQDAENEERYLADLRDDLLHRWSQIRKDPFAGPLDVWRPGAARFAKQITTPQAITG